jgi:hypothetical protein
MSRTVKLPAGASPGVTVTWAAAVAAIARMARPGLSPHAPGLVATKRAVSCPRRHAYPRRVKMARLYRPLGRLVHRREGECPHRTLLAAGDILARGGSGAAISLQTTPPYPRRHEPQYWAVPRKAPLPRTSPPRSPNCSTRCRTCPATTESLANCESATKRSRSRKRHEADRQRVGALRCAPARPPQRAAKRVTRRQRAAKAGVP